MNQCSECGAKIPEGAPFCHDCGSEITDITEKGREENNPDHYTGPSEMGEEQYTQKTWRSFVWGFTEDRDSDRNFFVGASYLATLPISVPLALYILITKIKPKYKLSNIFSFLPGIEPVNKRRRNVIIGSAYTVGGLFSLGLAVPEPEEENTTENNNSGFADVDGIEKVLELTDGRYWDMDISGDGLAMLTVNNEVVRLHKASGDSREIAQSGSSPDVLISEGGDSILATDHGTFTNYDTEGNQQWERRIENADGSEIEVSGVGTTLNFESIAAGSEALVGSISEDGDLLWETSLPAGRVWQVEISENGEYVAVRTENRPQDPAHEHAVHVYDNTGEHLWSETYDVPPLRIDISELSDIVTIGLDNGQLLVYDSDGELQWEKSGFGGYNVISDNGEWILAQDIENTVVFSPEGNEVWRYEMPDSEHGFWLYDRMDISNTGRSIGSYENIFDENTTVNVYDEDGEVIWQENYEDQNVYVNMSSDGSTWMINTRDQVNVYHDNDVSN